MMPWTQWTVLLAGLLTWYGFAARMRRAFRYADRWTLAKTLLVTSGWICTAVQLVALAWYVPPSAGHSLVALGLYALAYTLFRWALRSHGRDKPAFVFTDARPVTFCTAGPYRFIRHPLYAAYLLAWFVPVLATAQLWLAIPALWMAGLYTLAAWQEERAFANSPFATDYRRYRRQAGIFWPRPNTLLRDLLARCCTIRPTAAQAPNVNPPTSPLTANTVAPGECLDLSKQKPTAA